MREIPEDIKPEWFNVIRRLQSVAKDGNQGLAVLKMNVLVDEEGFPIIWTEPERVRLEPKRMAQEIIFMLTQRDTAT